MQDEANDANNRVGGFSYLDRKMGGTGQNHSNSAGIVQSKKWRAFPNNFVYAGNTLADKFRNRSIWAQYSSRSASDNMAF